MNDVHGSAKEFKKEAKLLHDLVGHKNIVQFLGASTTPRLAIMQEYVAFSFHAFGDTKITNSLGQFLQHADAMYDFEGFEHVPMVIAKDVIAAIRYLHEKDIVHRDLKPGNILVGNQEFLPLDTQKFTEKWQSSEPPITCKVTDFGESRSRLIQTQTLVASKVKSLDRGSPAFMAPEILVTEQRPAVADMQDLKSIDIWAPRQFGKTFKK